jgi:hypothetical protein
MNIGLMGQQVTTNRPYDSLPVHCNNHVSLFKDFNIITIIKGLGKFARRRTSLLFYVELQAVRVRLTVMPPGGPRRKTNSSSNPETMRPKKQRTLCSGRHTNW